MPTELKIEDGTLALIVPVESVQLHANPQQNISLITDKPDLVVRKEGKPSLFVHSSFLEVGAVAETVCNDGSIVSILKQPLAISSPRLSKLARQDTLVDAIASQTQAPDIYLDLSHKIVDMVSEKYRITANGAQPPTRDSAITGSVAQLIRDFVVKNFEPTCINFTSTALSSSTKVPDTLKLTPDFYASILPLNVVEIAAQQILQRNRTRPHYRCVGRTKLQERCKNNSSYDKVAFNALFEKLSAMAKPRDLSQVIDVLSDLVKMLYCSGSHLDVAERSITKVRDHFKQDVTSSQRKDDLKSFARWLTQLERTYRGKTETDDADSTRIPLRDQPAVNASDISAPTQVNDTLHNNDTMNDFIIGTPGLLGQEITTQRTYFSGSQTLQRYYKDKKKWELTDEQVMHGIQKLANKSITTPDLLAEGSIYIFRHSTDIGYHKIGRSRNVGHRLNQWAESCKYVLDERADLLNRIERKARHPHRLEQLIHAELITKRYMVVDCGCEKQTKHKEWFEVGANHAQKVIMKWTLWMQQNPSPYDEKGNRRKDISLPTLGVEEYAYLDNSERRAFQMAQEQANTRRKSGRDSDESSCAQTPAASTHRMTLRSDTKSRKRASEA